MISVCTKSLLNRNIPGRLQRGLTAFRFRPLHSIRTKMASTQPEPQTQAQAESLGPPQPQSPTPQELPKLSPSEYKVFNRMAERMEYFVSSDGLSSAVADNLLAQLFPRKLERHVYSLREQPQTSRHVNTAVP